MAIFNLLLSLSPLIYAGYFLLVIRKRYQGKGLGWNLEHGMNCYSCKEEIESLDEFVVRANQTSSKLEDM